jgi:hypothetical protein
MIHIAALLAGWPARLGVIAAAVVALVGLRVWDVSTQQAKGAVKVVEASKKAGAEANVKSEQARKEAAKPGAAKRLQSDPRTCVDC